MDCTRENKDLVSLNQKLLLGKNPRRGLKREYGYNGKSGWKAYDTGVDRVKNYLIAENMMRRKDNKKRLDFATNAVNPTVYPNFDAGEISESERKGSEPVVKKADEVSRNIERDNVLDEYQPEKEESISPAFEIKRSNNELSGISRQKYFIAQVRNYLPLVKDNNIREKLKIFLRYLYNTSSAKELTINERGHVQRGLFDTQTKFSDYLSYYILPSEGKRHAKEPPFYNVIIAGPLAEYLASNKQHKSFDVSTSDAVIRPNNYTKSIHISSGTVTDPDIVKSENEEESSQRYSSRGIAPLRNIKDSDLRLETSLPKMIHILTSLNIDPTLEIDDNDYDNLINIIAFPIYATKSPRETFSSKKKEYTEFGETLKAFLRDGEEDNDGKEI